jgi:hypothetical protein
LTQFKDLASGDKFSTKSGQFVKVTDERAIGFNLGDFMDCEGSYFNDVIPCGKASYLELVSLAHCTEMQAILEKDGKMTDEVEVQAEDEFETLALGAMAHGKETGCTEVGEIVGVMTAMGYCVQNGIMDEQEALDLFPWWTAAYPDWKEGLVVTLLFKDPVYPITMEKMIEAGFKEKDYAVIKKVHTVSFPEEDINVVE